jgi:hypothetical protein
MFRFVFSAVALAGVLATAHPVFADRVTATTSDPAHAAAAATEQPTPLLVPAMSGERGTAPAGFGWG